MKRSGGLALVAAVVISQGCGEHWLADVPPKYVEVAKIHHSSCGGCHLRVEAGERTRGQFDKALARHHGRVKMSEEDWALMLDYLSRAP